MTSLSHEESAVRARHADYYLRLFSMRAPLLLGKARRIALNEIGQEIENVRAAWNWAAQQQDYAALNQAVEPLYYFYQIHSRYQDGKEIFAQAWIHLQAAGEPVADPRSSIVPVRVLARHAAFAYFLCEYDVAGRFLRQCLANAQRLDQLGEVAFALNFLGQLAVWQGDRATAREQLNQSLTLSLALGDKSSAASTLDKLANLIHATFGEYSESKRLAEQSLAFSRGLGQPDWVAYALDTLGYITFCLGEYINAEAYYRESLALFETTGDQYGTAMALGGIGLVLWAMWGGKNVEATACFQKSLLICRTIGHQGQVCGRLAGLARIANDLGQYNEAQTYAEEGLAIARELGSPVYLSHILYCLGETAYGTGDLPKARAYLSEALQITSEVGLLAYLAIALFHYATLLVKESETASAAETGAPTAKRVHALRLLKLVQSHPATWHVFRERAARLARELADELPADCLEAENPPNQTLEAAVWAINQGR
jgi:tetratricopeptide (TPR) repeat protein